MKKIILSIILFASPLIINAQLTGDGTYSNPWSGTLAGDVTWSGTKFINGDIIVNNEKLTISPGTMIIFLVEGADLIITGTGQLEAIGIEDNMIRFTADDDNDGNYGETDERWGHISFQNMTTSNPELFPSIIDKCIIEYGQKTGPSSGYPESSGGGIYSAFTYLTITNSIIRNNYAGWGGGVYISSSYSPVLSNLLIVNNSAGTSAGGIYIGVSNSSDITNCIIAKNASSDYAGGIYIVLAEDVRFYNCVIASNISTNNIGHNILLNNNINPLKPRFFNTIIWGNNFPAITYWNSSRAADDFNYCAMSSWSSSYTSCISLSSSNTDPKGPNFINPDNLDYSIRYLSPCRDMGISDGAPVSDILGNTRILNYDIGAYEVQYSRWKTTAGTTDWNTGDNWDGGVPASTRDIIVPAGSSLYPTTSPGPDFIIGTGKQMIIEPGARVTLDDLTNNGTLKMNANASGLSSLIINSYSKGPGAAEEIQLRITGGYVGEPVLNVGKWHYISSPVQNFLIDPIFTTTTYNLAQWVDGIQGAGSIREGWVAYDGYMYITGGFNSAYEFSGLTPGKGYNLWYNNDTTYILSGNFNYANVPVSLSFAGDLYTNGYNLLGNPFPSGLDWDYIVENTDYPDNTSQGIIFTKDDELYYYSAGIMVPENGEPGASSGVIPPMQGFFVKTYSTINTINLTPDARTHDAILSRFKGKSEIPLLRLSVSESELSDETVVRFAENAKPGIDYAYDAVKMLTNPQKTAIYTSYGLYNFAINGQPFPDPETKVEIPLTVNLTTDGNHIISLKQLQALDMYDLYLADNTTGFSVHLNTNSSLSFSSSKGLIKDRFVIKVGNISTAIEDPKNGENQFNIYNGFGMINIQTLADEWDGRTGSVKVMDMSGKTVSDLRRTEFSKTSVTQIVAPDANGLYFIEIKSGVNRFVGKVVIK